MKGCLDHTAGVLMADKALRAVQDLAMSYGVRIIDSFTVDKVDNFNNFVQVTGGGKQMTCKSVILCPGLVLCLIVWGSDYLLLL